MWVNVANYNGVILLVTRVNLIYIFTRLINAETDVLLIVSSYYLTKTLLKM